MYSKYIKSPINYTGGKYSILDHIIPTFPKEIENFVDLFAGGFNVGINVNSKKIYANDNIDCLIGLYEYFKKYDIEKTIQQIHDKILKYGLSKENVEGYKKLRTDYNKTKDPLDLFVLICFSFNHQIRFNNKYEFNTSFGLNRSCYNKSIENNLICFCDALKKKDIVFSSQDFRKFDFSVLPEKSLVYCDPPYLITTAPYNDGWSEKEDLDLFLLLDSLDKNKIMFSMSNVLFHNGVENTKLIDWSKKYRIIPIKKTYSNCNYHKIDKLSKTQEVLIMNF